MVSNEADKIGSKEKTLSSKNVLKCEMTQISKEAQFTTDLDFLGGPVVKTLPSNARVAGLIPGQGTKIPPCLVVKKNKT